MYSLKILGDPILTTVCEPVASKEDIDTELLTALSYICRIYQGAGLAANQVGSLKRIVLVLVKNQPTFMINPEITKRSEEKEISIEGCLSIPGFRMNMKRNNGISVDYLDKDFTKQSAQLIDLESYIVQHEVDHLNGVLLTTGVSKQLRKQAERSVAKYLTRKK
jgi:peptide deformylase